MSLFSEIKRRKVFRLALAYVVIAWVIIQVVTAIEAPLQLPDWFDTAVIVLLGLGFPIAVMMSWAYDVTPDGVVRDSSGERAPVALQIDYGKIALGAVLLLGAFLLGNYIKNDTSPAPQPRTAHRQFEIGVPPEFSFDAFGRRPIAVSPDGQNVVLRASVNGQNQLFVRPLQSIDITPIAGTEGAYEAFAISPDGKFVVFHALSDGRIKKVSLNGGIPTPLGRTIRDIHYFAWGENGTIVYSDYAYAGLMRISAAGGAATKFSFPEEGVTHKHPSYIPGTEWLVLAVGERGFSVRSADRIALMSPEGEIRITSLNGSSPRVSQDGHLIYFSRNALWSIPFNLKNLEASGEPVPIVDDVYYSHYGHYDISFEGALVYRRDNARGKQSLIWVDRAGEEEPVPLGPAHYSFPGISPDGDLIAITEVSAYGPDLWTHSLSRGEATQRTFEESRETRPIWSHDGTYLYFEAGLPSDAFRVAISGEGGIEQLTNSKEGWFPSGITPDGRYLIIDEWNGSVGDGNNIGVLDLSGENDFQFLMQSDYRESHPRLSPDGTLLAYMTNRSGSLEIYVRHYPFVDEEPIRVSNSGDCWSPRWDADSREIFYWDRDDEIIYSVRLDTAPEMSATQPEALFGAEPYVFSGIGNYDYDRSRNKFLMIKKPPPGSTADEIVLIEYWQELIAGQNQSAQ